MIDKGLSERTACNLTKISRSVYRYESQKDPEVDLRNEIRSIAQKHRRFGYRRVWMLIRRNRPDINIKKIYRLYSEEQLKVRRRRRSKAKWERVPLEKPSGPGQIWAIDFIYDRLLNGRKVKILVVIDEYSREVIAIWPEHSFTGSRVTLVLDFLFEIEKKPNAIKSDNGTEFTSCIMMKWVSDQEIIHRFIKPGTPTENGICESFNGKLRDECLNEYVFDNLENVQEALERFKYHYNFERPHFSLDGLTPMEYKGKYQEKLKPAVV
jgi:putative transposase